MTKAKVNELAKEIVKHRRLYYNHKPVISDASFDLLCDELRGLDPDNDALVSIGAPVDDSEWQKANHEIPMGSLDKVNTPEEFTEWATKIFKPSNSVFITEKLDGCSIELIYIKGKLERAITRGDGLIGEDITRNVIKMSGVKPDLNLDFTGSLRGEIILKRSKMKKYFSDLANPRNAASGIAKRIDGQGAEYLDVVFYQVIGNTDNLTNGDFGTEFFQFKFIEETLNLTTPVYEAFASSTNKTNDVCEYVNKCWDIYHKVRDDRDYDIDGLVIRINNLSDQYELGDKHMRPQGAIAFKFRRVEARTKVEDIPCQTGNSGRITPVGEVTTVSLMGTNVSRASLYNFSYIKELGIDVGAEVLICKAGDVIPRIEEVIKGTGTVFQPPKRCPACEGITEMRGENLMCVSTDTCPAQKVGRLDNWISSLNVLEWGTALLERLVESGKVSNIVDLYKLSVEDLAGLERMGERSAYKCHSILWSHNELSLDMFLGSLSIPMIGKSMIVMVMNAGYDSLEKILSADMEDLAKIDGFGPRKSESLYNGLRRNKDIIDELLAAGIKISKKITGPLTGLSFCFTGTMTNKRKILEDLVTKNGGQNKSVGKGLTYLVTDNVDSGTGKAVAAKRLGTKLISEEEFLSMCDG